MAAHDKTLPAIKQILTADGGVNGVVEVASTTGFFFDQLVDLSDSAGSIPLKVMDVIDATHLRLGERTSPRGGNGTNVSAYMTANAAVVSAREQPKPGANSDVLYNVYEPAPVSGLRVFNVDALGNPAASGGGGGAGGSVSVTNNVSVTNVTSIAAFQFAKTSAASITAGNANAGTAFPAISITGSPRIVTFINSLNAAVGVTLNGTQIQEFEAGESQSFDLNANHLTLTAGQIIGLYNVSATSTSGSIRIQLVR